MIDIQISMRLRVLSFNRICYGWDKRKLNKNQELDFKLKIKSLFLKKCRSARMINYFNVIFLSNKEIIINRCSNRREMTDGEDI